MIDEAVTQPSRLARWRLRLHTILIGFLLIILPILNHAGGLGIAPFSALIGFFGILTLPFLRIREVPEWVWALALFLGWALLTSIWSPYQDDLTVKNPVKLGLGAIFYLGLLSMFRNIGESGSPRVLRHILMAGTALGVGILLVDFISGYGLTYAFDPLNEGEDNVRKMGSTEMNLGHAVAVISLLLAPVCVLMVKTLRWGAIAALALIAGSIAAALMSGLTAGLLAMVFALIIGALAAIKPIFTLRLVTWVAILSILGAPLLGYGLDHMSPELRQALPYSWQHRVEMWVFTAKEIFKAPFFGAGFDAVRTFDQTFIIKGIEWAVVSLHPHNAGLHIWVETGLLGAAFASVALLAIGTATERFIEGSSTRAIAVCGFFTAAITISNMTFGVWQEWWWATLFLVASILWLIPKK